MIVLDASALTDFLLARTAALDAVQAAMESEEETLHAPELIEPETMSALRKLVVTGELTEHRASEAVADLAVVRLVRYPHAPLRERVWELRHSLTPYDASYLALAEALGDARLVTADGGLAAHASGQLGADRVVHLA
jgi:predicted nucleic acid-binding protein